MSRSPRKRASAPLAAQLCHALIPADLTLVSQWLGHAHLETTLVYAHADTEHKRKAIAAATPADNPLHAKLSPERFTVSDEDTLKRLTGLR